MRRSEPPPASSHRGPTAAKDTVVWVRGDHDLATKASLAGTIASAARLEGGDVIVDLSGVTFMDASIIGTIIEATNHLRSSSQHLAIRCPSPRARRVFEACCPTLLTPPVANASAGTAGGEAAGPDAIGVERAPSE